MIRYRYVGPDHSVTRGKDLPFPVPLGKCKRAIVAFDEGVIVGWLRYEITEGPKLWACGTWVDPPYRGEGVAHTLWGKVMQFHRPQRVVVRTISTAGRILVGALVRWFSAVEFEVLT